MIVSSAGDQMADNLSAAILDQNDPELVREGMPAFMLLLDSMVRSSPDNPEMLGSAARLYAVYGTAFVDDPERARTLTARAHDYGSRALCAREARACDLDTLDFEGFAEVMGRLKSSDVDALYSYSVGYLSYIRTHSADFGALIGLPKAELALVRLLEIGAGENAGSVNMYLGILNTLRPPALGGKPELAREYFENALVLTDERDLSIKVEYARGYARLLYERELHDRLLNEVLSAEVRQEGFTLANQLAQQQAKELLATADDYF
jgi:TRAP transporter T-component